VLAAFKVDHTHTATGRLRKQQKAVLDVEGESCWTA
jgi:hypothetical protein